MRRGAPSLNPSGRPPADPELRQLCREKTTAGVDRIYEIRNDPDEPGATRVAAWCALRDTGFGKPAQAIAFKDFTEAPPADLGKTGSSIDRMADVYAWMIGATTEPPVIDVAPSRSAALSDPQDDDDHATVEILRRLDEEEQAERQQQSRAQPRERIIRRRR